MQSLLSAFGDGGCALWGKAQAPAGPGRRKPGELSPSSAPHPRVLPPAFCASLSLVVCSQVLQNLSHRTPTSKATPQPALCVPVLILASLGQIVQELLCFLYRLASTHKDYAVVLCCLGAKDALTKVLEKHSAQLLLACELRDLVTECEKHAQLYSNLTSSILAGCIQVSSTQVQAEGGGRHHA